MKDVKVLMRDMTLTGKIGRNHRTDHSSPTRPTNALTVQVVMELGIVLQDSNRTHLPLATQLMAEVFRKIAHNLKIILLNEIHNKVHPQCMYHLPC